MQALEERLSEAQTKLAKLRKEVSEKRDRLRTLQDKIAQVPAWALTAALEPVSEANKLKDEIEDLKSESRVLDASVQALKREIKLRSRRKV